MASTQQTHLLTTSGPVKRFSNRCAPVNNNWFTVGVGYGKTPDMKTLYLVTRIRGTVNATEHQCSIS
jgi:hypothetical protein